MSYGANGIDLLARAASYVDRILRGEWPSELPVQAPTKFELVINLKTAKSFGLGSAAAWPIVGPAQQSNKRPKIGVLWHAGSADEEAVYLNALRNGLNDFGYIDGKNIVLENRFPAEKPERFPVLARERVALHPDVLVAVTGRAADAMQQAMRARGAKAMPLQQGALGG